MKSSNLFSLIAAAAFSVAGFTLQEVACAGEVQPTATCPVNPLMALTVTTFVKVADWPAFTVCVLWPAPTVNEKSGGPVRVTLNGLE